MGVDAARLRKEGLYEAQAPLQALAGDFDVIERLAMTWRKDRKHLHIAAWISIVLGIACIFLSIAAGLTIIAGAITIFLIARRHGRAVVLNASRCGPAKALGVMLANDASGQAPVNVRLAFDAKRELLSEQEWPARKKGKQKFFRASWFSLETKLLDGTQFSETIEDLIRQRSYVNPRGKSKTKTRTRNMVTQRFVYPSELYGNARGLGTWLQNEIKLPASATLQSLKVDEKQVRAKALVKQGSDLANASSMLALGVYRALNLSRRRPKGPQQQ